MFSANVYSAAPRRSVPAAGIEFVEEDILPNWRTFFLIIKLLEISLMDGESDIQGLSDTNEYRITAVVSASCAPGLAQHWHRTSGRWLFL